MMLKFGTMGFCPSESNMQDEDKKFIEFLRGFVIWGLSSRMVHCARNKPELKSTTGRDIRPVLEGQECDLAHESRSTQ